jgi:putative hydrolase of the HAD superfamily
VRRRGDGVWLFDLDDTLHHASGSVFADIGASMNDYMVTHLGLDAVSAKLLRHRYWRRYGATLLGLVRHHGVSASHFLAQTHALPQLEASLRAARPDLEWLKRLRGRKVLLTNAPEHYAKRVLKALGIGVHFERVLAVEHMRMFGQYRPKPDTRMFRHLCAQLRIAPSRCTLVEDSPQNLKAARGLGMRTIWMRGWMTVSVQRRPQFVDQRVSRLRHLKT